MRPPLITIIMPSFNQAGYLEQALDSIAAQDYPHREVLVIDGGSTDGTADVLEKRSSGITWWCSEPDRGQTHAINKGLARMTGDIWMYLNSDDLLSPGALRAVARAWADGVDWVWGDALKFDEVGEHGIIRAAPVARPIDYLAPWSRAQTYVLPCSCACFLSRRVYETCGPFDESLHYGMDKDYYVRALLRHGFEPVRLGRVLAKWRLHPGSKTMRRGVAYGFLEDQIRIAEACADCLPRDERAELLAGLPAQRRELAYRKQEYARANLLAGPAWGGLFAIAAKCPAETLRGHWWSAAIRTAVMSAAPDLIRTLRRRASALLSAGLARGVRRSRASRPPARERLLIPPAAAGSIGDEAMVEAWVRTTAGFDRGVASGGFDAENLLPDDRRHPTLERLLSLPRRQALRLLGALLRDYRTVDFVGADVLDGHYSPSRTQRRLELIAFAADCGVPATILGCSLNATPEEASAALWARLPTSVRVCARDPRSKSRIEALTERAAEQTADVAFLLPPSEPVSDGAIVAQLWLGARLAEGLKIVGLNLNPAVVPGMSDVMADTLGATLAELGKSRGQLAVLLVPHDRRVSADDTRLLTLAAERLAEAGVPCHLLALPCGPSEIKGLAGRLHGMITSRMHLGIACLGAGVPVAAFEYQGKFAGMFELFDLPEAVFAAGSACDKRMLTQELGAWFDRLESSRAVIRERLPEITRLARLNIFPG